MFLISFIFSINQKLRIALSLIYLGFIALLSLLPSDDFPEIPLFPGADKIVHTFMYMGFAWLACWSVHPEIKHIRYYLIIILSVGWGILMEVFQFDLHLGRSFEWFDVLANVIGTLAGVLIYNLMVSIGKDYKPDR